MKFRISGKDLMYFVAFAILLFYLCAVGTSNIHTLSTDGTFAGLNPILGLTVYLGPTLIFFIILLIVIFTSVSSYIFERKKGVGIEIGEKDSKGYSRWSKEREIKNDKDVEVVDPLAHETDAAGIPLVNDGKKLWVDNGEYHNLVIGATGSGKSQTCVEPMVEILIKHGESMIITDPKGELYHAAADYLKQRGYNVVVLNFRDPQRGNAWNPLTLPFKYYQNDNKDKAVELLNDVALNILYDPNNKSGDPFWEKSSADYFAGLALGLFEDAKEEEVNLNSISLMSTVGEDKFAASNFIKEYFTMKGEGSTPYGFASNTINAPNETKGGILSVFRQKIRQFSTQENLSEMLSYSDFDMQSIGQQKTAVFIVIHDEKTTYHGLATIFIKQCYETLIDVAQKNGGKLPYRTNFILDEFANMPPLRDVTTMVTAARSRKMRFTFIIQNFAQLKSVYGNENAETIKGNCGNLVYLISTELAALEEISKMCGEVKSSDKDKTASTPLVSVTDLQKLKLFEAIIIRWRMAPFKTKYTPNFKMDWGHSHDEIDFPVRQKREVQKFDIKEFVKEKKRKNMLDSLDNGPSGFPKSSSPMGGGFDPFASSGRPSPMGGGFDPFASSSKPSGMGGFPSASSNSGMFGGIGGGLDLDAMMADIDRKIAELDAEEKRQKEELDKKGKDIKDAHIETSLPSASLDVDVDIPKVDLPSKPKFDMDIDIDTPKFDLPSKPSLDVDIDVDPLKVDLPSKPKFDMDIDIDTPKIDIPSKPSLDLDIDVDPLKVDLPSKPKFDMDIDVNTPKIDIPSKPNLDVNIDGTKVSVPTGSSVEIQLANESKDNYVDIDELKADIKKEVKADLQKEFDNKYDSKIETKVDISVPKGQQLNLYDSLDDNPMNGINIYNTSEITVNNEKPNIAVATGTPIEETYYEYEELPKVESVDVVKPVYSSGTVVKANDHKTYNIYDTLPDIVRTIDDDIQNTKDVEINIVEDSSNADSDKVNVNISPDSVVIENNVISDDEFFDDFFGDE